MKGFQFTGFRPEEGKSTFEQLLELFIQLLTYTNGDVGEALQWLNQIDREYELTRPDYGMGDFIDDLKSKGYIDEDPGNGSIKITPKTEQGIRKRSLEEIFGKLKKTRQGNHQTFKPGGGDEHLVCVCAAARVVNLTDQSVQRNPAPLHARHLAALPDCVASEAHDGNQEEAELDGLRLGATLAAGVRGRESLERLCLTCEEHLDLDHAVDQCSAVVSLTQEGLHAMDDAFDGGTVEQVLRTFSSRNVNSTILHRHKHNHAVVFLCSADTPCIMQSPTKLARGFINI